MVAGLLAGAALLAVWSLVEGLWQLYCLWILLGIASSAVLYEAAFADVARRLGDEYRLGITVITLFGGFASTVFVPFVSWVVAAADWRSALLVVALLQIPLAALLAVCLRGTAAIDRPSGLAPTSGAGPVVRSPARRRLVLANLATSYAAFAFVYTALLVHFLPMLEDAGLTAAAAVLAYAVIGPSQFLGRLLVLLLERGGRWNVVATGLVANLLATLACVVLLVAPHAMVSALAAAVLFGSGMGIKTIVQATAAADLLGRSAYGAVQGLLTIPALLAQAAAPFASAVIWQQAGGYPGLLAAIIGFAALSLAGFAGACLSSARR
jgi:MFS family permease